MSTITVYSQAPAASGARHDRQRVLTQHNIDFDRREHPRCQMKHTPTSLTNSVTPRRQWWSVSDDHHWSGFRPDLIEKL